MEIQLHPPFNGLLAPAPTLSPALDHTPDSLTAPARRSLTALSFLLSDLVALLGATGLGLLIGVLWDLPLSLPVLLPVYGILVGAYALFGMYNVVTMHPAQELRAATTLAFIVFAAYFIALSFWPGADGPTPAFIVLLTGSLAVGLIPVARALARVWFARCAWWGMPTVVVTSKEMSANVIWTLRRWPEMGIKPIALLYDDDTFSDIEGVRVLKGTKLALTMATSGIPYALIARPDLEARQLSDLVRRYSKVYERVFVVPHVSKTSALWTIRSPTGEPGSYGVRHCNRQRMAQVAKRLADIVGALLGLIVLTPLLLVIAVLIVLDSEGGVLYRQHRMGQNGRCFKVLKFRSMYQNAEERLQVILNNDPIKQAEYAIYHKLRDDPRITRVGTFLRHYSLDELPQLLNVLRGDLSLVGPRAYMPGELDKMDGIQHVILQNRPGITGLWQVAGRNELSFQERLEVDVHYVLNWTPWFDLYIMARTVPVVLHGEGAA